MNSSDEARILDWFERALEQTAEHRSTWLAEQNLSAALQRRVQRLIEAEASLDDEFLETAAPLPEPAAFPKVGDRIGQYELLREIDNGGMGTVYLARRADRAYEQRVAIKLIRSQHLHASRFRRQLITRFENERALLARLNHRNVARILDGGSTDSGFPYLVMEYIEGISLLQYCDAQHLDLRSRVQLMRKVCDGVQEAHRHLIVHRDLKPENILVGADGEPRLLDFGIARTLETDGDAVDDSKATMFTALTPAYASPEQVRREQLTTSSDVYSLGVVLYELITTVRPYELKELTPAQAERLISDVTPPPLRTALANAQLGDTERERRLVHLAPDLERIIFKAMHKEAARRYASAQELSDELGRYLDGKPVFAYPDSFLYRLRKFVSRHQVGSIAAVLAIATILTATGVAFWQAAQARQAARDTGLINAFLMDVLKMSDPFDAGSELTLSQALDEAATLIDARFDGRADLSAEIRFGIGYSMLSRYRLEAAEQQLTRALQEHQVEFGSKDIRTLRVEEGLAGLRQEQGRPTEAKALYKQIIAKVEANGLQRDPLYATLLGNLGNLYLVQEEYADAQKFSDLALQAQPATQPDKPTLDYADTLSNLAHAAHGLEQYDQADTLYRQAQQAYEVLFPDGNPDLAILLNNRALLAEDRGRQPEALALHRQSLAVRRRVFGREHPMIVVALAGVARKSAELGERENALKMAQEAVAMADRVYKEPIARHASVYATLAEARLANHDATGAVSAWQHAQALLDKTKDPPPSVGRYLQRVRVSICAKASAPLCAKQ